MKNKVVKVGETWCLILDTVMSAVARGTENDYIALTQYLCCNDERKVLTIFPYQIKEVLDETKPASQLSAKEYHRLIALKDKLK